MSQPITPHHPRWSEFMDRLIGPEGCNFQNGPKGDGSDSTWECYATIPDPQNKDFSRAILEAMGFSPEEVAASLAGFGTYCDCEIVFNMDTRGDDDSLTAEPPPVR